MSFPRYPEYKESGVAWLGEVPAYWSCPPLYLRYHIELGKMLDAKRNVGASPLPYLRNVDVQWGRINTLDLPLIDITPDELERYTVRPGDLLVCEGGEVGRAAVWRGELEVCAFQKALHRLRPSSKNDEPNFLRYVLRCVAAMGVFEANGNPNTIPHLTGEAFRLYRFPKPPLPEQRAIASFLDRETTKIDALVAEQERLIALLKEKRQALISHVVTKGLNPDVPMKASGDEWLGSVPAHWTTTRLKYAAELIVDCPHETPVYSEDGEYMVIRTADLHEGSLRHAEMYRVDRDEYLKRVRRSSLLMGDVVYSREGERWGHGALVPANDKYCLGQRMMQFRAASHTNSAYLMWHLNSFTTYAQGETDTVGATSPHVNVGTIRNFALSEPPLVEQVQIAEYLSASCSQMDLLIDEAEKLVLALVERRLSLVTAAVTGRIDVRGLAPVEAP